MKKKRHFPPLPGNFNHVTFANKDHFPATPGKCAYLRNMSSARQDPGGIQKKSRLTGKICSDVNAYVIPCSLDI